eukprot:6196012-Pleurochrysis_carterae.AAC.3
MGRLSMLRTDIAAFRRPSAGDALARMDAIGDVDAVPGGVKDVGQPQKGGDPPDVVMGDGSAAGAIASQPLLETELAGPNGVSSGEPVSACATETAVAGDGHMDAGVVLFEGAGESEATETAAKA